MNDTFSHSYTNTACDDETQAAYDQCLVLFQVQHFSVVTLFNGLRQYFSLNAPNSERFDVCLHFLSHPDFRSLICLGGLNYDEDYDEWQDSALFNTHRVYKNRDPTQNYQWETHANLKRARAKHNTVWMGGQIYHVAGYAKVTKFKLS